MSHDLNSITCQFIIEKSFFFFQFLTGGVKQFRAFIHFKGAIGCCCLVRFTSFQKPLGIPFQIFNLLQVRPWSPPVVLRSWIIFTSFHLEKFFSCLTLSFHCLNFVKFRDAAPLTTTNPSTCSSYQEETFRGKFPSHYVNINVN